MDDVDRSKPRTPRRALDSASGTVLRATRKGALVLETENARRMMRRFRSLKPEPERDTPRDAGAAPARP